MSAVEALRVPLSEPQVEPALYQRVRVSLLGRCMFSDYREFPCHVTSMSPGEACVVSPSVGTVGERVVAYIDHLGRVEGAIQRHIEGGFEMHILASRRKRDKMADTLTWIANRHVLGLPEDRRHARLAPKKADALLTLPDGSQHSCRIIDMSVSGAAVATTLRPPKGAKVLLGKIGGRVVRHFEDGIALEFMRVMSEEPVEEAIQKEFF